MTFFVILTDEWNFVLEFYISYLALSVYLITYLYTFFLRWHQQYTRYVEYQVFLFQSCAKTATILLKVSKYPSGSMWAA